MWENRRVLRPTPGRRMPGLVVSALVAALALVADMSLAGGGASSASVPPAATTADGAGSASHASGLPRPASAVATPTSLHVEVGTATDTATGGYWLVASDGGVFSFNAPFLGSAGGLQLVEPIVGMAATQDGGGYWLVAADGGVFSYGDARFFGSTGGRPLNRPIVGMAAARGGGYWLVAADGGVFAFGAAAFFGSTGGITLNRPMVGMAVTAGGAGYWLVAADGGVFCFGDAPFVGSTGGLVLNRPMVGLAPDVAHGGYWMVAADGGVFSFGASFAGAATGKLVRAAVALAPAAGGGYRVISASGGVFTYGGAPFYGSVSVPPMAGQTVAIDAGHDGGNAGAAGFIGQPIDSSNLTEPCDTVGTETADGYAEHAFNFDVASRLNSILQSEGASVVMTRTTDDGVGPCVDVRAGIANTSAAAAAISIHADGGPASGRGFDVTEPAPVVSPISDNTAIVPASAQLAAVVRDRFASATGEPASDYAGSNGIDQRGDLGGLNLSTVPKVLIECANMQNPIDAALTETPQWRQQAAVGLADGVTAYMAAQEVP